MSSEPDYELRATDEQFHEDHDRMAEKVDDPVLDELFMTIRESPRLNSVMLKGSVQGLRAHTNDSIRVIFACCDECIGRGHVDNIDCHDCEDIHGPDQQDPQDVIKLFRIEDVSPIDRSA